MVMEKEIIRENIVEKRVMQLLEDSFIKGYLEEIDYGETGELTVMSSTLYVHKYDGGQIEKELSLNNIEELDTLAKYITNQAGVAYNTTNWSAEVELDSGLRLVFTTPGKRGEDFTMLVKNIEEIRIKKVVEALVRDSFIGVIIGKGKGEVSRIDFDGEIMAIVHGTRYYTGSELIEDTDLPYEWEDVNITEEKVRNLVEELVEEIGERKFVTNRYVSIETDSYRLLFSGGKILLRGGMLNTMTVQIKGKKVHTSRKL